MSEHLRRDLEYLKKEILLMGALAEQAVSKAILSLLKRRPDLAEEVARGDDAMDVKELEVEEECLKILALHQPVAGDLRFIIAILKVNSDLERIGDLALNIAERSLELNRQLPIGRTEGLEEMSDRVQAMVREAIDSLVRLDARLARRVCSEDDRVDELHRRRFAELEELMRRDPDSIGRAIGMLSVSKYLERVADHATNVAEDVVFMIEGTVIRHHKDP